MHDWIKASDDTTIIYYDLLELLEVAEQIAQTNEFFPTVDAARMMLDEGLDQVAEPLLKRPGHPQYNMATGGAVFTAIRAIDHNIYVTVRPALVGKPKVPPS